MNTINDRRRELLKLSALLPLGLATSRAHGGASPNHTLRAAPASMVIGGQSSASALWLYNNSLPGPELRLRQSEPQHIRFVNGCPDPSAVHWHGLRIDNAMDGAGGLTQALVASGAHFDYRFSPPDAGTYWYHPHGKSWQEQARGLSGALIIEEREAPGVDMDLPLLLDDWLLDADGKLSLQGFGDSHEAAHAGRLGNALTCNGHTPQRINVPAGGLLRLRLINVCNSRTLALRLSQAAWLVAEDGQPLAEPLALERSAIELAVGQRVDLMLHAPAAGVSVQLDEVSGKNAFLAAEFKAVPSKASAHEVVPLPANPLPTHLALQDDPLQVALEMTGGAMTMAGMKGMRSGGGVWQFNGVGGMPEQPWFSVAQNRTVVAELSNDTRFSHAMHLHGHHFQVLSHNGEPPVRSPWRDTVLMQPGDQLRLAFVADNPGKWMAHCHMVEHQLSGMTTWFDVARV